VRLRKKRGNPSPESADVESARGDATLTLYVPRWVLSSTHSYFLPYWEARVETACYWFGAQAGTLQVVTTLATPRLIQTAGDYRVDMSPMRRLSAAMRRQGLQNLAQVHTHPGADVGHSWVDDARAYSTREGALSLVWPHYGRDHCHDLRGVGIQELRGGKWVDLDGQSSIRRVRVVDSVADYRWEIRGGGMDGRDIEQA
jgi:hypothetical protein